MTLSLSINVFYIIILECNTSIQIDTWYKVIYNSSPPPEWGCVLVADCMWTRLKPWHRTYVFMMRYSLATIQCVKPWYKIWSDKIRFGKIDFSWVCLLFCVNLMQSNRWWLQCADTRPPACPSNTRKEKSNMADKH